MSGRATIFGFLLLAAALAIIPLTAANEYELRLFMLFMIYGMIAVGLNVLVGLSGLVSLGQAGLFALGAYTAAILATKAGFEIALATIAAIVVTSIFGALLAYPTVRVRGVYLAVITIAFGLIVENAAIEWKDLTGGTTGISSIPKPSILGFRLSGYGYYAVLAVALIGVAAFTHNLKRSRFGRAMLAVSQSETAARNLGINAPAVRTLAFVISAATAGLAGSLYAFLNSYISPDIFTFSDSIRFLLMVIFGGAGTTTGAFLGAFTLTYLPEYLQQFQAWQNFIYGLLLAMVMFVLPSGMFGTAVNLFRRFVMPVAKITPETHVEIAQALQVKRPTSKPGGELVAEDLTVRFDGLVALDNVSVRVRPGEIHALIGPNGAGKSTFVNTISGFYRPNEGRFQLDGVYLTSLGPHRVAREGLSRTFQNTELFGDMTVIDNVMVGYQQRFTYSLLDAAIRSPRLRREEKLAQDVAITLLSFVGLTEFAQEKARFLPFGLQRRLEIARALAAAPRLLLLDEPAAGLTTHEIDELSVIIRKIADLGISVLLIEHHVDLIMAIANHVTVLDYGRVIASDAPDVVQDNPEVIAAYFGTPTAKVTS